MEERAHYNADTADLDKKLEAAGIAVSNINQHLDQAEGMLTPVAATVAFSQAFEGKDLAAIDTLQHLNTASLMHVVKTCQQLQDFVAAQLKLEGHRFNWLPVLEMGQELAEKKEVAA